MIITIAVASITIYGAPAPQGSKAFKGVRGGRGVMVESSKKVGPWRDDVRAAALAFIEDCPGWTPLDGPLIASLIFTLKRPVSLPKKRRWPDRTPDLSKLARSTEDALVSAGLIVDDARIVKYQPLSKIYVGEDGALASPGAYLSIWRAE